MLSAIPTLERVVEDRACLEGLPVQVLRMLRARALSVAHAAEIEELGALPSPAGPVEPGDCALTPEDAAAVLGCPPNRLRHHARLDVALSQRTEDGRPLRPILGADCRRGR